MGNANLGAQSSNAPLPGGAIANVSISDAELAANAVTAAKIASGAVTAGKVATGAIAVADLAAAVQALLVPAGAIVAYGGTTAPTGWLLCNGDPYDPSLYPNLFAAIGNGYGGTSGSPLRPDFRGRVPYGLTSTGILSARANNDGVEEASRTPAHSHTTPSHQHSVPAHYHGMGSGATLNISSSGSHGHSGTANEGGGHSHNMGARNSFNQGTTTLNGIALATADFDSSAAMRSGGSHTHTLTVNDASHTHGAGNFGGVIGLVNGGVDGNGSMTSGPASPSTNSSIVPYGVANYIIKF
jgi:hypothetical protein